MATESTEIVEPVARRWSVDEYYRMAELGMFRGQHVELIDGEILQKCPHDAVHAMCVALAHAALRECFGSGHTVRVRLPLRFSDDTEPEPDLAVVSGSPRDYLEHPTTALLVVEVSVSTLDYDLHRKAGLYARAGVPDYWVLDIASRRLLTFREPVADATRPFGFRYALTSSVSDTDQISPIHRPDAVIRVESLLP